MTRREEVFTVGGRLAVFSFRQEAEAFLGARSPDGEWRVREFWARELVCVLYGPLSGVGRVALDPLPEVEDREVDGLVTVSREEFVERLVSKVWPLSLRPTGD